MELGAIASSRLLDLISKVESKLGQVLPFEVVEKFDPENKFIKEFISISLNSFWSPLPTKLPPLSEPLVTLNEEEQTLLGNLENNTPPVFTENPLENVSSSSGVVRTDPFGPIQ